MRYHVLAQRPEPVDSATEHTTQRMARVPTEKQYLLEERRAIVFERLAKGYSQADVARMLGVDKSVVSRIVAETDAGLARYLSEVTSNEQSNGRGNAQDAGVGFGDVGGDRPGL